LLHSDYLDQKEYARPWVVDILNEVFDGVVYNAKNGGNDKEGDLLFKYKEVIFNTAIGCGKCLTGESIIKLDNGTPVEVKDLYDRYQNGDNNYYTYSLDENKIELVKNKIKTVISNGYKYTFEIFTTNKKIIRCTSNHPFWGTIKQINKIKPCWRQLHTINVGEKILTYDWEKKKFVWDRIKSIKFSGVREVYDLSMENINYPSFVANEFIVHNSYTLSLISCYVAYLILCLKDPCKFFNLAPGSKFAIVNNSITQKNAKRVVFSEIYNKILTSPWFQDKYRPNPRIQSELQFDYLPDNPDLIDPRRKYKSVTIIPGSSSEFSAIGLQLFLGIIDEASKYPIINEVSQAETIYTTMDRRVTSRFGSRGLLVIAGSPQYTGDWLDAKYKESLDDELILTKNIPLWEAKQSTWFIDEETKNKFFYFHPTDEVIIEEDNPKKYDCIKIPDLREYRKAFEKNPSGAKRDLGGMPSDSLKPFFTIQSAIDKCIDYTRKSPCFKETGDQPFKFKDWFRPISAGVHIVHADFSLMRGKDSTGISIGHIDHVDEEGSVYVYIDAMIRMRGTKEKRLDLATIREVIYELTARGFNIGLITTDRFQSYDCRQILEKKGYNCDLLSVDQNIQPYNDLKEAVYEKRVNYYDDPIFIREIKLLEDINGKRVDHPPGVNAIDGMKNSKDISDSVAGVVHNLIKYHREILDNIEEEDNQAILI